MHFGDIQSIPKGVSALLSTIPGVWLCTRVLTLSPMALLRLAPRSPPDRFLADTTNRNPWQRFKVEITACFCFQFLEKCPSARSSPDWYTNISFDASWKYQGNIVRAYREKLFQTLFTGRHSQAHDTGRALLNPRTPTVGGRIHKVCSELCTAASF